MARKIISKRIRKLNVLRVKSKSSFLLRQKSNLMQQKYDKKQSKINLNEKELKLIKNSLEPLIKRQEVNNKVKKGERIF